MTTQIATLKHKGGWENVLGIHANNITLQTISPLPIYNYFLEFFLLGAKLKFTCMYFTFIAIIWSFFFFFFSLNYPKGTQNLIQHFKILI